MSLNEAMRRERIENWGYMQESRADELKKKVDQVRLDWLCFCEELLSITGTPIDNHKCLIQMIGRISEKKLELIEDMDGK